MDFKFTAVEDSDDFIFECNNSKFQFNQKEFILQLHATKVAKKMKVERIIPLSTSFRFVANLADPEDSLILCFENKQAGKTVQTSILAKFDELMPEVYRLKRIAAIPTIKFQSSSKEREKPAWFCK